MFLCCLVSSLSPIVFYQFYFQCFPLAGLRLSFLLICVPPRPKTAWLVLRSVVPYRSLFFLPLCASTLTWTLSPATLSLYKFALSWLPFSRSAKSFPDRLFYRPGILFPAPPVFYALLLLPPSVFGCVSLIAFLDALSFPTNHALPVIWVAGSLFVPLCYTPVFLPLRSGAGFFGPLLFRHPPACCPPLFAHFRAQPVVPARP